MINIIVDIRDFNLKGLKTKINRLPNKLEEVGRIYGDSLVRRVKRNITIQKLKATGEMWRSTKWTQAGMTGILTMPTYAYELQMKRPRSVIVKPYTKLWRWAFLKSPFLQHHATSANFPALKRRISGKKPITLHQYDVYASPIKRTNADLRNLVERRISAHMRGA